MAESQVPELVIRPDFLDLGQLEVGKERVVHFVAFSHTGIIRDVEVLWYYNGEPMDEAGGLRVIKSVEVEYQDFHRNTPVLVTMTFLQKESWVPITELNFIWFRWTGGDGEKRHTVVPFVFQFQSLNS